MSGIKNGGFRIKAGDKIKTSKGPRIVADSFLASTLASATRPTTNPAKGEKR